MRNTGFIVLASIFFIFCSREVLGQLSRASGNTSSIDGVRGGVRDSSGRAGIPFAHVHFIHGKDTVPVASDMYGYFSYKGIIADTMRLRVTAVGYKTLEENYYPKVHGFNLLVRLQAETMSLNEIIITGK